MSCNLSLALIWQMTYTHKLPKLCSATLNGSATDQVTDSFELADCQELTVALYFDQSKTSRRDSVKIYFIDQRGPATVRNLFCAMLSFLDNYVTHNFSHFRAALTGTTLLSAWSPI